MKGVTLTRVVGGGNSEFYPRPNRVLLHLGFLEWENFKYSSPWSPLEQKSQNGESKDDDDKGLHEGMSMTVLWR